jgi:Protein of unknown function (DUF998)
MIDVRRAAGAGMLAPTLFVAVFTIEGWLRPNYRAREMFVSELSRGPRGWIQILNFVITGVLLLVFTRGVSAEFRKGRASRAGPMLLTIIALGFLVSGPLVTDPASTPHDDMTLPSKLHWAVGGLVFTLQPVSCFVFLRRFRVDPGWRSLQWPTLTAGIITSAAVLVMSLGPTQPPAPPNAVNAWNGVLQRALIVPYLAWIFMFARRLRGFSADG